MEVDYSAKAGAISMDGGGTEYNFVVIEGYSTIYIRQQTSLRAFCVARPLQRRLRVQPGRRVFWSLGCQSVLRGRRAFQSSVARQSASMSAS